MLKKNIISTFLLIITYFSTTNFLICGDHTYVDCVNNTTSMDVRFCNNESPDLNFRSPRNSSTEISGKWIPWESSNEGRMWLDIIPEAIDSNTDLDTKRIRNAIAHNICWERYTEKKIDYKEYQTTCLANVGKITNLGPRVKLDGPCNTKKEGDKNIVPWPVGMRLQRRNVNGKNVIYAQYIIIPRFFGYDEMKDLNPIQIEPIGHAFEFSDAEDVLKIKILKPEQDKYNIDCANERLEMHFPIAIQVIPRGLCKR